MHSLRSGSAKRRRRGVQNDRLVVWVGALVVLAVIALAGYVVTRLASSQPGIAAGVLTALAAVLAALPPIIKALRGR
jgi:small-conductance mechanosensitive channel